MRQPPKIAKVFNSKCSPQADKARLVPTEREFSEFCDSLSRGKSIFCHTLSLNIPLIVVVRRYKQCITRYTRHVSRKAMPARLNNLLSAGPTVTISWSLKAHGLIVSISFITSIILWVDNLITMQRYTPIVPKSSTPI